MEKKSRKSRENIDVFHHLEQKKLLIKEISKEFFKGSFIDIGCGIMPYKKIIMPQVFNYMGVDIHNETYASVVQPDKYWDGKVLPFKDEEFDSGMLIEVLEHTPEPESVLKECSRVLKKNSHMLITVPFLWNLHDVPHDEYRYTPYSLNRMINNTGFKVIKLKSFGNWDASMASMLALYVKRSHMNEYKRKILLFFLYPVINYLFKRDAKFSHSSFYEGLMITGLWALVQKQ